MDEKERSDPLTERLDACYTGALHDVMRAAGLERFTLPPEIRPLDPENKLCGPVWTVSGGVDESADSHQTLFEWTGLLSKAPSGHVVICQPNDSVVAHMGELSARTWQSRGIRGYIVDGGCRDVSFILSMGFPVYCRYLTPRDVVAYWLPRSFGEPITIGEVDIRTGDYVLADRDGAIVLPAERAAEIVAETEKLISTENDLRRDILAGIDPQTAFLKHQSF